LFQILFFDAAVLNKQQNTLTFENKVIILRYNELELKMNIVEMNIVEQNIDQVSKLLEQYNVDNMYLFGSVLTNDFSPTSDIDFLVNFGQVKLENYFDNYIGLKSSLEDFFNRSIDLVEEKTVKNPILRRSIDRNKKLIYGRTHREMAV